MLEGWERNWFPAEFLIQAFPLLLIALSKMGLNQSPSHQLISLAKNCRPELSAGHSNAKTRSQQMGVSPTCEATENLDAPATPIPHRALQSLWGVYPNLLHECWCELKPLLRLALIECSQP